MNRKIVWSPEAASDYEQNIDYLLENWSVKEAQQFIDEVSEVLRIPQKSNVSFKQIGYKDIRIVTVCCQINLFYRINKPMILNLSVSGITGNPRETTKVFGINSNSEIFTIPNEFLLCSESWLFIPKNPPFSPFIYSNPSFIYPNPSFIHLFPFGFTVVVILIWILLVNY
jgi:plasmid stabilization system protein ParE